VITAATQAEAQEFALMNFTKSSAHARFPRTTDFMEVIPLYWGRVGARRNLPLVGSQLAVTVLTSVAVSHISVFVSLSLLLSIYGEWFVCVLGSRLVRVMVWLCSSISTLRLTALYSKPLMNFCLTLH